MQQVVTYDDWYLMARSPQSLFLGGGETASSSILLLISHALNGSDRTLWLRLLMASFRRPLHLRAQGQSEVPCSKSLNSPAHRILLA